MSILIVDDNTTVQTVLRDILEATGQELHSAYTGEEGLDLLDVRVGHCGLFGNDGADTIERILDPEEYARAWYKPNPPLPKVLWSQRNNNNYELTGLITATRLA